MSTWMLFSLAAVPPYIAAIIFAIRAEKWRREAEDQRRRVDDWMERIKNP